MIIPILLWTALASSAIGGSDLNVYLDGILKDFPIQAMATGSDPARLPSFQFVVAGNGFTERDLDVNVTQGSIFGLRNLQRRGNCSYGYFRSWELTCVLGLDSVEILTDAEVTIRFRSEKGDSRFVMIQSISTSTRFENDSALLIQFQRNNYGDTGSLSQLQLYPATMTSSVTRGIVYLTESRIGSFAKKLNAALIQQLSAVIREPFSRAIRSVMTNRKMPDTNAA